MALFIRGALMTEPRRGVAPSRAWELLGANLALVAIPVMLFPMLIIQGPSYLVLGLMALGLVLYLAIAVLVIFGLEILRRVPT